MNAHLTEHQEQALLVAWLQRVHPDVLFHSIPNGAQLAGNVERRMMQINKLKAEGLTPGCADLFLAEPRGKWKGRYVEMKSLTGNLNENQTWFLDQVEKRGYFTILGRGFNHAREMVETYLNWSE